MKTIFSLKLSAITLLFSSFLATDNLLYRNAEGGLIKIQVPSDFKYVTKANYKPRYKDDGAPDDYYSNADRSEEVLITIMGGPGSDVTGMKPLIDGIVKTMGKKVYFNNMVMMNGEKVWVLEFDGMDGPTLKYIKYVFFNVKGSAYMAASASLPQLKDKWKPVSDKIMANINW